MTVRQDLTHALDAGNHVVQVVRHYRGELVEFPIAAEEFAFGPDARRDVDDEGEPVDGVTHLQPPEADLHGYLLA